MAKTAFSSVPKRIVETTIDPASVTNATAVDQTFTIAGLKTSDWVIVELPALEDGLVVSNAHVSAANTLKINFANVTGAPIDPASQAIKILVL